MRRTRLQWGFRYSIQQGSETATALLHRGGDYQVFNQAGIVYGSGEIGLAFNQDADVGLSYEGPLGLRSTATGQTARGTYSHLDPTVSDWEL